MKTLLIAGYPKSGNTLLGGALKNAGHCDGEFDIYSLVANKKRPSKNNLFKSDTYVIKTHDRWKPNVDLDKRYFAPVEKVVVVIRNPLDTLLSSINFLRVQYMLGTLDDYIDTLNMLFPGKHAGSDFLDFYSLDNLKKQNLLDPALDNFSRYGACIPCFSKMSGPWAGYARSYTHSALSTLNLRYEDLAVLSEDSLSSLSDDSRNTLSVLSEFLNVNASDLLEGFKKHRMSSLVYQKSGDLFFNKMRSGYWRDYFSRQNCQDFVSQYATEIIDNGYNYLVEEFF